MADFPATHAALAAGDYAALARLELEQLGRRLQWATIAWNGIEVYGLVKEFKSGFRAVNELDNGITYINAPTIGAEAHLPFGGVKQTGNGHREGGWEVYEFYSETKVCYLDYSGKLQRAQIDNYDASPY